MFETFEHRADIGVRGIGKSIEEAFAECAKAMFGVMADLRKIDAKKEIMVKVSTGNTEQLLVNFLNELLYQHEVKGMLFNNFELYITEGCGKWFLKGKAFGEKIDGKKHALKGGVKAATFHQLLVEKKAGKWVAQCVLDV